MSKKEILLMGNPNVGKSVIFSKLTGIHVESSNFTGTTVDYTKGDLNILGEEAELIDVPGTYSLSASSEAELLAIKFLESGADGIIYVLDASHLERNLDLALKIREYNIPTVYVLNLVDVASRQGISIDKARLSEYLEAPVVATIAVKNQGLRDILIEMKKLLRKQKGKEIKSIKDGERLDFIKEISKKVITYRPVEEKFIDRLEEWTIRPWPGIPIAFLVILISLGIVVGGGKALRSLIFLPLVNNIVKPFFTKIISIFIPAGTIRNILVGEFGIFIIGIEWPFALILPYVFLFYLVISFLEDSGYLPRIGVLADGLLKRIGIQGGNIIPMIMGYGCAVPAIIGTRAATSHKERIIVASLVAFAIPCASQTAAFISLLGDRSLLALILVYLISLLLMLVAGLIMNRIIPGKSQPILLEVPNLLWPDRESFIKKLKLKMRHFLLDAEGPMLIGIFIAAIVAETGVLNEFSKFISPMVVNWLGLPEEASLSLLLGIIRRELAVLPLLELDLNTLQLLVGSVMALFYLPCLSVFGVLIEEFSLKLAITIGILTTIFAFFFGGLINHLGLLILRIAGGIG